MRLAPCTLTLVAGLLGLAAPARAETPGATDEVAACIRAFDEAQRLRTARRLEGAKVELIACMRAGCPTVLAADCASVLREVEASTPTVVFAAVDGRGHELTDVTVLEGDRVLARRLDGAAIPLDPGPHTFRVQRGDGPALEAQHVAREGEKNRIIRFTLAAVDGASGPLGERPAGELPRPGLGPDPTPAPAPRRSTLGVVLPAALAGLGLASLTTSGVSRLGFDARVDELRRRCAPECTASERSDLSDRLVTANVALAVGVVATAAAIVTWFALAPGASAPPSAAPRAAARALWASERPW